jgi:hypothetical protein
VKLPYLQQAGNDFIMHRTSFKNEAPRCAMGDFAKSVAKKHPTFMKMSK